MNISNFLGISENDASRRVDSGVAEVYERTIEIAGDIIALENIGTIRMIDGKKNHTLTVIGIAISIIGFFALFSSFLFGLLVLAAGIGLTLWSLSQKIEIYLSLGTCDGRSTVIISKNRQFLKNIRDFLRKKIDTKNQSSATINISNSTLEGAFAIGDKSSTTAHYQ
ncbi:MULTISPECIES: DUF6232 family protein [unclassified Janthinobacterium]|uniref:DUF6232 family protein n=1 Tax=unclassified Janthinobacterium TaxID=2610881 RepID=UPI0016076255|nr:MULTISPECIES: DUF6232 family protein [unclassified Janthinobacterium]MBB5368017.1 hypothetical protein [Janthinobacterium sp. K2C7]MBB5379505.1 hypothetical protein [Janthinobacterium sp. K2Li3]MBB5386399.1 hypothetical protein [Janthinobacterium sp. K2E3]